MEQLSLKNWITIGGSSFLLNRTSTLSIIKSRIISPLSPLPITARSTEKFMHQKALLGVTISSKKKNQAGKRYNLNNPNFFKGQFRALLISNFYKEVNSNMLKIYSIVLVFALSLTIIGFWILDKAIFNSLVKFETQLPYCKSVHQNRKADFVE